MNNKNLKVPCTNEELLSLVPDYEEVIIFLKTRKQVARALSNGWNVSVEYLNNIPQPCIRVQMNDILIYKIDRQKPL